MDKIREFFKNSHEKFDIDENEYRLDAELETAIFLVVKPHSGTNNKWMLRVSTVAAFDHWANSTAVQEFFDTDIELCNYLYDHRLEIYKELLKYLSKEYEELEKIEEI